MIKTDKEYKILKEKLDQELLAIESLQKKMRNSGIDEFDIIFATESLVVFAEKLKEEIQEYEDSKNL